jgi:site-specific DNA recombinase
VRAAVYARRSVEEVGKADDAKSVTRQLERARAFAASQGWHVVAEFVDDGISGTEYEKRDGLQRFLAAADRRSFQVVVVSERKSLSREMTDSAAIIKRLSLAGIEVFEYVHGKSLTPRSQRDKLLATVEDYAQEDHSVRTGERVHESHDHLIDRSFWPGGRIFGYRLVNVFDGTDRDATVDP